MREDLVTALKRILIDDLFVELPEDRIGMDDGLQSVLGLDSVSFAELRMMCERQFSVEIVDADFTPETFRSLRCLVGLLDRLQSKVHSKTE